MLINVVSRRKKSIQFCPPPQVQKNQSTDPYPTSILKSSVVDAFPLLGAQFVVDTQRILFDL